MKAKLVELDSMPMFPGTDVPLEFYWIISEQPPLAGMPSPPPFFSWDDAKQLGFHAVVCLTTDNPSYDAAPLSIMGVGLEDLCHGGYPSDPQAELLRIRRAVEGVLQLRRSGKGVIVHCAGGRGRSGTVIGGVLVACGTPIAEVARWLDHLHRSRGHDGWPESCWQLDVLKSFQ